MRQRLAAACAVALVSLGLTAADARANEGGTATSPASATEPASVGNAALTGGQLVAGFGGSYTPIPPSTIRPAAQDPGTASAAPPYPAPGCPPGFSHLPPSADAAFYDIYPTFTRNADGGYDGHDEWFGYSVQNAIPAGGDASRTDLGAPATAANIAGHKIAVLVEVAPTAVWGTSASSPKWSNQQFGLLGPDVPGHCEGGALTYGFGQAFIDGAAPAGPVPDSTLNAPPFGLGPTLLGAVTGQWRIGTVDTLPGPGNTTRTFVHIPTCAWLDSGVPTAPATLHSVTTDVLPDGYTVFLVYNVTVTPGPVTWDWGDGTRTASTDAPQAPPAALPSYDATAQAWSDTCSVSHDYVSVNAGRTVTATQTFDVAVRVTWNDGVETNARDVPCEPTAQTCALTIGAAQGWQSGPHPVDQIEPVPYSPQLGG